MWQILLSHNDHEPTPCMRDDRNRIDRMHLDQIMELLAASKQWERSASGIVVTLIHVMDSLVQFRSI
jgi:hypothetical protein